MDPVGVRKLPELPLQEVEQRLQLLVRPSEVLRREGVQRQLLDTQFATPVQHRLRRLRAGAVAVGGVSAVGAGVPPVAVLDDRDVFGHAVDLPTEESLVHAVDQPPESAPVDHCRRLRADR